MHGGSIVDATIIQAPSSTKNKEKARDPEMHQTKKGNQWYFGMKVHAGVDAATAANTHDIVETHNLIREDDHTVYADFGYLGIANRDEIKDDKHLSEIDYRVAMRPSQLRITPKYEGINWDRKIEHPFHIVKNFFGVNKAIYRGLKKPLCTSTNSPRRIC